jgi:hypothetical protein
MFVYRLSASAFLNYCPYGGQKSYPIFSVFEFFFAMIKWMLLVIFEDDIVDRLPEWGFGLDSRFSDSYHTYRHYFTV